MYKKFWRPYFIINSSSYVSVYQILYYNIVTSADFDKKISQTLLTFILLSEKKPNILKDLCDDSAHVLYLRRTLHFSIHRNGNVFALQARVQQNRTILLGK